MSRFYTFCRENTEDASLKKLKYAILCHNLVSWRRRTRCKSLMKKLLDGLHKEIANQKILLEESAKGIVKHLKEEQLPGALEEAGKYVEAKRKLDAFTEIDKHCKTIEDKHAYICSQRTSKLYDTVRTAVATLVYAAVHWCDELPALEKARDTFREWFGTAFDLQQVDERPRNSVEPKIKQYLPIQAPDQEKQNIVGQIAEKYNIKYPPSGSGTTSDIKYPPSGSGTTNNIKYPTSGSGTTNNIKYPPSGSGTTNNIKYPPSGSGTTNNIKYPPSGSGTTNNIKYPPSGSGTTNNIKYPPSGSGTTSRSKSQA